MRLLAPNHQCPNSLAILNNRDILVSFERLWSKSDDRLEIMSKASKGTVSIQSIKGRLRLAWRFAGKRYFLSLELPDTSVNRSGAEFKARLIERDIALDAFDPTLAKYKPSIQQKQTALTVQQLVERYIRWKSSKIDARTVEKYQALLRRVDEYFGDRPVVTLYERDAENFRDWLLERQVPITVRDRLQIVKAAWKWGMKQGLIVSNPWEEVGVKVPAKQSPRPFTLEEIKQILNLFRSTPEFAVYGDYVEFLFGTGCRTGEAIGLRWKHVTEDCSQVWIGEIMTKGKQKPVKTNRPRNVPMTPYLQRVLQRRKPNQPNPEDLVFLSPEGNVIDDANFRGRAWTKVLEQSAIAYRKPYISRSTLISHALAQGMAPALVAQLVGNSVDMIYKHYAGYIQSRPELPDILGSLNQPSDDSISPTD